MSPLEIIGLCLAVFLTVVYVVMVCVAFSCVKEGKYSESGGRLVILFWSFGLMVPLFAVVSLIQHPELGFLIFFIELATLIFLVYLTGRLAKEV